MPETLFEEMPQLGWLALARQLVDQLLITVPDDYHAIVEQLAQAISAHKALAQTTEALKAI